MNWARAGSKADRPAVNNHPAVKRRTRIQSENSSFPLWIGYTDPDFSQNVRKLKLEIFKRFLFRKLTNYLFSNVFQLQKNIVSNVFSSFKLHIEAKTNQSWKTVRKHGETWRIFQHFLVQICEKKLVSIAFSGFKMKIAAKIEVGKQWRNCQSPIFFHFCLNHRRKKIIEVGKQLLENIGKNFIGKHGRNWLRFSIVLNLRNTWKTFENTSSKTKLCSLKTVGKRWKLQTGTLHGILVKIHTALHFTAATLHCAGLYCLTDKLLSLHIILLRKSSAVVAAHNCALIRSAQSWRLVTRVWTRVARPGGERPHHSTTEGTCPIM